MNTNAKQNTVGLKELRENMEIYIKRVGKGESLTVFRRSTPLFQIVPTGDTEDSWETVADFTRINKKGVSARDILTAIKKMR